MFCRYPVVHRRACGVAEGEMRYNVSLFTACSDIHLKRLVFFEALQQCVLVQTRRRLSWDGYVYGQ